MYARKQVPPFEVFYRMGTVDEKVINHSFSNDIFYRCLPELKLDKNAIVVDIGAHIGTFSMISAKKNPHGLVYAIEAGKDSFDVLRKNREANALTNLKVFHCALADRDGEVSLYHSEKVGNWGFSITKDLGGEAEKVKAVSFDNFIASNGIEQVDLLKSNCEGAEFGIFLNTKDENIRKIKLGLILFHCDLENQYTLDQLISKFESNNFMTEMFNKSSHRGWLLVKNKTEYSTNVYDSIWNQFLGPLMRSKYVLKLRDKMKF